MKKDFTELVFILDRSGSMGGLETDTIGGFNSLIEKQKKEEGTVVVSTVLFDDQMEIIHDRVNLSEVKKLTDKEYYVRGCTALLDAVGSTIRHIESVQKGLSDEEKPEKTLFVITTDGFENASKEYTYKAVKSLIDQSKKNGFEYLFLGANIDAEAEAERIGISRKNAVRYQNDKESIGVNYDAISATVSHVRMMKCVPEGWSGKIKENYKKKTNK